jgi:nucleotide-binding universal stress UspA family protein
LLRAPRVIMGSDPQDEEVVMTRTVAVGYDGSEAARAAVDLALERVAPDGHLIVVHAYEVPLGYYGAQYYGEMLEHAAEQAKHLMAELRATLDVPDGIIFEEDIVSGIPADALCRAAETHGADEIILGSRGLGRFRAMLGSVAHEVLHKATCPVTVIPERMFAKGSAGEQAAHLARDL